MASVHRQAGHMTALAKETSPKKCLPRGRPHMVGVAQPGRARGGQARFLNRQVFVSGLDHGAVMRDAIEQCGRHLRFAEDGRPFAESDPWRVATWRSRAGIWSIAPAFPRSRPYASSGKITSREPAQAEY
jgi:hypothetical protein